MPTINQLVRQGKIVADRPISAGKAVTYGIGIFVLTLIITMIGGLLFI